MKLRDFEKSKKELEKQIEKNNQPFLQYDEQYRMAKTNQTEYKIGTTLFFSLLAYLAIFIGSAISLSITGNPLLASIPRTIYPVVILGASTGLGIIGRTLMEKKFRLKERLRAFTNAKTDTEKLVEEIKNEIELKKMETRNHALREAMEKLTADEQKLKSISERYVINEKEERTQDSAKAKSASLMSKLQEKFIQLDSLVAKKVISDRFFHQRQKGQSIMDTMMMAGGCGIAALLYYTLTLMTVSIHVTGPLVEGIGGTFTLFAPAILTGTAAGIYHRVRNRNYQKAFSILNATLKDEALPSKSKDTFEERQTIQNLIDKTISEIVTDTIELQEERRYLETFNISTPESDEPAKEITHPKELVSPALKQTYPMESDFEAPSLEEVPYETSTTHSGLHQEIRTLTKRRKQPYQE